MNTQKIILKVWKEYPKIQSKKIGEITIENCIRIKGENISLWLDKEEIAINVSQKTKVCEITNFSTSGEFSELEIIED